MKRLAVPTYSRRNNENSDLLALWCLRIFLNPFLDDDSMGARVSDRLIRIAAMPASEEITDTPELLWAAFEHRLKELERKSPEPAGILACNLRYVGETLSLSEEECSILAFATLINTESMLDDTADLFGRLSNREATMALDETLRLPPGTAARALGKNGNLVTSGLLELAAEPQALRGKLPLLSGFENALLTSHDRPEDLFSAYLQPSVPPKLGIADYPHVRDVQAGEPG